MPPKGKQGTKGQKQIAEENKETVDFYIKIIVASNIIYLIPTVTFFWHSFTIFYMIIFLLITIIYYGSYRAMKGMATPTLGEDGSLLDGGVDLNMKEGMAEHLKDLILLTAVVQVVSLFSNYCWLFLLLAPGRAFYLLWVNFLGPWFFAEAPEADEKKTKKMERRLKKRQ